MEFVLFGIFVVYLVPWLVAMARDHERPGAILAVNLLLGWTAVGWLAALAWAALSPTPAELEERRERPDAIVVPFRSAAGTRSS